MEGMEGMEGVDPMWPAKVFRDLKKSGVHTLHHPPPSPIKDFILLSLSILQFRPSRRSRSDETRLGDILPMAESSSR